MLATIFDLMKYGYKHSRYNYILGTSAIAHTYCRQNAECSSNSDITNIVLYLQEMVQTSIKSTTNNRDMQENVILTLKALGNIGIIKNDFDLELKQIIDDEDILLEIRLQAVYVFRRLDCYQFKYD